MKKFAKMSLAAAVAVAGLSSTASAVDLEQAIKGVDISGQFRYRFQELNSDNDTTAQEFDTGSDVEVEVTAVIPVNDNVTATIMIDNENNDADANGTSGSVDIEEYFFTYTSGALAVSAGYQTIPGPITDGAQGDGIVASYAVSDNFTVLGAAFANHSIPNTLETGAEMVASVAALGSVGPVALFGQYALAQDVAEVYNLKADADFGMINAGLEWTDLEFDGNTEDALSSVADDRSTFKAYVGGSVDIVTAKLTYAQTGDNGSGSLDNQTTTETETPAEYLLWNVGTAGNADMDVWALDVSAKVTDKITLRAAYADGEIGDTSGNDVDELLGQISYQMSPNLNTYVRYSTFDNSGSDDNDNERARIEVRYTF